MPGTSLGALRVRTAALVAAAARPFGRRITDARARARWAEEMLRDLAHHTADWFWETDSEHRYYRGPLFQGLGHRLPFDDVVGLTREQIADPDDVRANPDKWRRHREDLDNRRPFKDFEYRLRRPDGSVGWARSNGWPVYSEAGGFLGYRGTATDIDTLKSQIAALAESQARFELAAAAAKIGTWHWYADDGRFVVSASLKQLLGYRRRHLDERIDSWWRLVHPEDRAAVERAMMRTARRGRGASFDVSCRLVHRDGGIRWVQLSGHCPDLPAGAARQVIGAVVDNTDRALAEQQLRRRDVMMGYAQRLARLGGWECDAASRRMHWSDMVFDILGTSGSETAPSLRALLDRVHAEDRDAVAAAFEDALRGTAAFNQEFRVVCPDGERRVTGYAELADNGRTGTKVLFGVIQDVTESRRMHHEIMAQHRRLLLAEEVAQMGYWELDVARNTVLWSDQTYRLHGVSPETFELTLDSALGFYPEGDADEVKRHLAEAIESKSDFEFELQIVRADGELRNVHSVGRCHVGESGEVDHVFGVFHDVTEHKTAQAQLIQAQKMEAVGQLAGGIAHDFNNILTVVSGNLDIATRVIDQPDKLAQSIAKAADAARRAAELTKRLLAFSRNQVLEPQVLEVDEAVSGMRQLIASTVGDTVELATILGGAPWPTRIDRHQLENALLNLSVNARDAMPTGGRLTIETSNAAVDEHYARMEDITPGDYVLVQVTDTGTGMAPELARRVFEPFFTTKGSEKGSGLGLSMVYGFVKQSKGHIKIYSEEGRGSTVKMYFPRHRVGVAEEAAAARPAALPADETPRGAETVLVVDDDDGVRGVAAEMLDELGYRVLEAGRGDEALATLEADPGIDLLLTDVAMPGKLNGLDLAERARELRPHLTIILTSGYAAGALARIDTKDPSFGWINKPFDQLQLARKVREVLSQARDGMVT